MLGKEFKRYHNLYRNIANWYVYPLHKFGLQDDNPIVFETRQGYSMEVPRPLIREFKEIFMTEAYLKGFPIFELDSVKTVVDIGANAGFFSLFSLTRFPNARVISFEPFPPNFRLLQKQRSRNPGRNFKLVQMAVSGTPGTLRFYSNESDDFSTSASLVPNDERHVALNVESITLEGLFNAHQIKECDLLKMDSEGAEYETFLQSSDETLSRIKRICMEVHHVKEKNQDIGTIVSFLHRKGFETRSEGNGPLWMLWAWRGAS